MSAMDFITSHESALRLTCFAVILAVLAIAERLWPARGDAKPAMRQVSNISLIVIDSVLVRIVFPVAAVALATRIHAHGGGLFGYIDWPQWIEIALAVVIFDAAIYWQHRLLHRFAILWRMHRVHHTDTAFDVTTAIRFHPFEMIFSLAIQLGVVVLLGPHPAAVVLFAILLSAASLFTHADFALPPAVERVVRWIVVTPTMHRIHHSIVREETDSNYGFLLSVWDRIFGSYRARSASPQASMPIGLEYWRDPASLRLDQLLIQPFRRQPTPSRPADPQADVNS